MENNYSYIVKHLGDGKFQVEMRDGSIKEAGSNLCGMIRYVYFEDYTMPEIGWQVTSTKLMEDYMPKMQRDVLSGKIKPNQMNY